MKNILQKIKDPISCLTHLAGALLSIVGLYVLLNAGNGPVEIIAFAIFGFTMMLMYSASTVYHMFNLSESGTKLLRKVDHIMIYLFIAGSFTPFTLLLMEGPFKWTMISIIWGIAIIGVVFKLLWLHAPKWVSLTFYLGMGWLGLIILPYAIMELPSTAAWWVIAGGLSYTFGAVIYGLQKPNPIPEWFGFHEIWHLFVMGGSFCHFWAIYRFLPTA
jgi:hemolysin III